jgi:uncharacterized protein
MLQQITTYLVKDLFGLTGNLAGVLSFFIYDSVKILLLLFFMISLIGFLRTYIDQNILKKWLSGRHELLANFSAALFGAVTPFCSCSSIPIFLSFIRAGIPLGTALTFLVTSPLINEYLVVLMFGFFGLKVTVLYILSGLTLGMVSGTLIGHLHLEKNLEKDFRNLSKPVKSMKYKNIRARFAYGLNEGCEIVKQLWLWVLFGVGVGALIHNYVPQELVQQLIGKGGIFTVPLAVLLGVPMYGSCAAILPIALVLFDKGLPLGTALAFTMAVSALSLPEAIILRRAMNLKLISIFFGIVTLGIIITGYLFNVLI